jgi:hypothetical protein
MNVRDYTVTLTDRSLSTTPKNFEVRVFLHANKSFWLNEVNGPVTKPIGYNLFHKILIDTPDHDLEV